MDEPTDREKQENALGERARKRLETGHLPRASAARSWGGQGSGLPCALCDQPIAPSSPEMELEFDGTASSPAVRFHLKCHSAWELARRTPEDTGWLTPDTRLPPFDIVVEARVGMSGSRTVILGVVRARGRASSLVWLNATTNSQLPASWRLLEWRYPAGLETQQAEVTPRRA